MTTGEEDVTLVSIPMQERESGAYYVAEPFSSSDDVLNRIPPDLETKPLLSIVGLEGVGYRPPRAYPTVAYAVRWGELVLEYGSHSWQDPQAVIR